MTHENANQFDFILIVKLCMCSYYPKKTLTQQTDEYVYMWCGEDYTRVSGLRRLILSSGLLTFSNLMGLTAILHPTAAITLGERKSPRKARLRVKRLNVF